MSVQILKGDCRDVLREMPDESVHCVVTSPPYWGLRDYGVAGQIGLENTPDGFVDVLVDIFKEVRRVLRPDGTAWVNLGDSYSSNGRANYGLNDPDSKQATYPAIKSAPRREQPPGLKSKDLVGIPWRVAFALQADGWYLRQDIIWSKPNPMPESVRDRCTKAHEYLFLLSKSEQYYYDQFAIFEKFTAPPKTPGGYKPEKAVGPQDRGGHSQWDRRRTSEQSQPNLNGRNKRSVWEVATQPFSEAHFATFPPALIEPCILAGCPEKCCAKCGAPWVREVGRATMVIDRSGRTHERGRTRSSGTMLEPPQSITLGFSPSCSCNAGTVSGAVLDPFGGAGTTGLVTDRLGRNAILIELNPEYAAMAERRIRGDAGMFANVTTMSETAWPASADAG